MRFKAYLEQVMEAQKTPQGNYLSIGLVGFSPMGLVRPTTGSEVAPDQMHVTLMYSKSSNLDCTSLHNCIEHLAREPIEASIQGYAAFDSIPKDGERDENLATLVLKLYSPTLNEMHQILASKGCQHSYPEFSPHLSLYYGVDRDECHQIVKSGWLSGLHDLVLLHGIKSNPIDEDWAAKNVK